MCVWVCVCVCVCVCVWCVYVLVRKMRQRCIHRADRRIKWTRHRYTGTAEYSESETGILCGSVQQTKVILECEMSEVQSGLSNWLTHIHISCISKHHFHCCSQNKMQLSLNYLVLCCKRWMYDVVKFVRSPDGFSPLSLLSCVVPSSLVCRWISWLLARL